MSGKHLRHGLKRGSGVQRKALQANAKAYAGAVRQASKQYDGHNGEQAIVLWARLKTVGDAIQHDGKHNAVVAELTSEPLPKF